MSDEPQIVWVVERGCYESRYVEGVYATAEAAMAANPPRHVPDDHERTAADASRPGGWQQSPDGSWDNGLDWDEAGDITPMEVAGASHD